MKSRCESLSTGDLDRTDFFESNDPELARRSLAWSNAMNQVSSPGEVDQIMDDGLDYVRVHSSSKNQTTVNLEAAEIVRGSVVRVLGHRQAMAVAPLVTRILNGDTSEVETFINDPLMRALKHPTAGLSTDFERRWYGDDARLLAVTAGLMYQQAQRTAEQISPGVRHGVVRAAEMVMQAAFEWSVEHGMEREAERAIGCPVSRFDHFAITSDADRGGWRERFIVGNLVPGPRGTVEDFLEHNAEAASEHAVAYLTDVYSAFWPYEAASVDTKTACAVSSLHLLSALAFMGNLPNIEAEYKGRYAETEPGSGVSARQPLIVVTRDADAMYRQAVNPESAFSKARRATRYRCPGPDSCDPAGEEVAVSATLRHALQSMVRDYGSEVMARFNRNFSEIDVVGSLMIGVARSLIELGYIRLDQANAALQLKQGRRVTSTGAYVIRPKQI